MKGGHAGLLLLLALAAVAVAVVGQGQKVSQMDLPKIAFEKYRLANGLEVILAEDHRLPMVAVNVWYHVGPANEEPGRTGFAHLFEHMMFQGTKHVKGDAHFRLLERAGSSNMNGTTDFDRTNYFETVPSNQLDLALWLEADRMGYLLDQLDQAKLSNQQDVVRNERRQTTENVPYGIVAEAMYHQLFPAPHPYYGSVIGSHADIQAATLGDVREFFRRYYAPNNATVVIAGDIDRAQAKSQVNRYFATLRSGSAVPKAGVSTAPISAERRVVVRDRVELERVYIAWITPPILKPGNAEGDLAAHILGGGRSSRLYKKLVYEKQIAQSVSGFQESLALGSVFSLQATARPGHTAAELETAIEEELERFRRDGPLATEVEGARNSLETRLTARLETLNGLADRLNYYNHHLGDPGYLAQDIDRYRKATAEQVRAFAQNQLKPSSRVVVQGVPGRQELGPEVPASKAQEVAATTDIEAANADEPWRNEVPRPAGATPPLRLPAPNSFQLPNGLTVIHTERPGLPLVAARLVTRTGSDSDPLDKPGIASFTAAMLDQGTATRSALEIADEVAQLGATLDTESTMDALSVTVRSLKRNFPAALHLLADVALHPAFPEEEISRQRADRLASLLQRRENASIVADQVTAAALYGPRHPYGYPEIGTEASIKAVERADLLGFWKKNIVPNNAALVVAGGIPLAELKALVEKELRDWQAGSPARPELGSIPSPAPRVVLVDKPGAAQTQLRVGTVGVPRSTPDYAALEIMNNSLGGLFSSRINMNLREDKGYTYGARSGFNYRRSAGPFTVRAGVRTDVTAPAVTEIFKELRRMSEDPITADEFSLARDSIVLSLPGRFETTSQAVSSYANVFIYDLGTDYYTRLPALYSGATLEGVRGVARKYLAPEKMIVVAAGDRARIEPELRKLNLGPVEIRDADGNAPKP
jgi:zinc protease